MIVTETISDNLIKTYSDAGVKIHGGCPEGDYDYAIDPADMGRTYTETDIPIEDEDGEPITPTDEATVEDYKQALVQLGVIEP